MEAKLNMPVIKAAKPSIILAPQPKAALTAAMPAQVDACEAVDGAGTPGRHVWRDAESERKPSGDGGRDRQSLRRDERPGSRAARRGGIDGNRQWNEVRLERRNGRARSIRGHSGGNGNIATGYTRQGCVGGNSGNNGSGRKRLRPINAVPTATNLEVLSKPPVQYTSEARQLKVQGDVILRVTFTANGRVMIAGRGAWTWSRTG